MRKMTGLAIAAILTVAGCSGSGSGTAPGGSGGGTPGSGQTQGAARGSITIDGNRHDFTGGTCHDDRPTAATSDFVIMFYPPNGDYMDISLKSGYVVMVAGTIGGTQFNVREVTGTMGSDEKGSFSGKDAMSSKDTTGTFTCS
jgi:hypothetical protein